MNKLLLFTGTLALLAGLSIRANSASTGDSPATGEPVMVWNTPGLSGIASAWIDAYSAANPGSSVTLIPGTDHPSAIGLVTGRDLKTNTLGVAWKMALGRDVIVPVMNARNPLRDKVSARGLAPGDFTRIYSNAQPPSWGELMQDGTKGKINAWLPADASVLPYLADFLNSGTDGITASKAKTPGEMFGAIRKDVNAIGFCRLADFERVADGENGAGLMLVPVDMNGNGKLDHFENIYSSPESLARGLWIGKYPKDLTTRIYAVLGVVPQESEHLAFLGWLASNGQPLLADEGFTPLTGDESLAAGQFLAGTAAPATPATEVSTVKTTFLTVAGIILGALVVFLVFLRIFSDRSPEPAFDHEVTGVFNEHSVRAPGGLFFDRTHTWVFMEKEGYVRTGLDDFLAHVTGSITRVKMKAPGDVVRRGEPFLSLIQHGKQIDILSPVSGTVIEHNRALLHHSSLLNSDPLAGGWVYRVEPLNWLKEIRGYLMGNDYSAWVKTEFTRLKDFFTAVKTVEVIPVLQEGGEMKDGVLEGFGPEVWEEFQSGFINLSR